MGYCYNCNKHTPIGYICKDCGSKITLSEDTPPFEYYISMSAILLSKKMVKAIADLDNKLNNFITEDRETGSLHETIKAYCLIRCIIKQYTSYSEEVIQYCDEIICDFWGYENNLSGVELIHMYYTPYLVDFESYDKAEKIAHIYCETFQNSKQIKGPLLNFVQQQAFDFLMHYCLSHSATCKKCNLKIPNNMSVCPYCGAPLKWYSKIKYKLKSIPLFNVLFIILVALILTAVLIVASNLSGSTHSPLQYSLLDNISSSNLGSSLTDNKTIKSWQTLSEDSKSSSYQSSVWDETPEIDTVSEAMDIIEQARNRNAHNGGADKPANISIPEMTARPSDTYTPNSKLEQSNNEVYMVYITDSGSKYHRQSCQYLAHSSYCVAISYAQNNGYEPCSRCHP